MERAAPSIRRQLERCCDRVCAGEALRLVAVPVGIAERLAAVGRLQAVTARVGFVDVTLWEPVKAEEDMIGACFREAGGGGGADGFDPGGVVE